MNQISRILSGALLVAGMFCPSLSHAGSILIEKTDTRAMTNVSCDIEYVANGKHYYDWQDLGSWTASGDVNWGSDINQCSCNGTQCSGDCLFFRYSNGGSGQRIIIAKMDNPTVYQDIYVSCSFTINDACHTDWEYLGASWAGTSDINLVLNGMNGSWDGSCWGGDLLRHK